MGSKEGCPVCSHAPTPAPTPAPTDVCASNKCAPGCHCYNAQFDSTMSKAGCPKCGAEEVLLQDDHYVMPEPTTHYTPPPMTHHHVETGSGEHVHDAHFHGFSTGSGDMHHFHDHYGGAGSGFAPTPPPTCVRATSVLRDAIATTLSSIPRCQRRGAPCAHPPRHPPRHPHLPTCVRATSVLQDAIATTLSSIPRCQRRGAPSAAQRKCSCRMITLNAAGSSVTCKLLGTTTEDSLTATANAVGPKCHV